MSIHTYIKSAVAVLFFALVSFGHSSFSLAQGCQQVEIGYEQPDCYKQKNGATGSLNRDCTPVTVCANQRYTYTAAGGPWATYLWAVASGPASPTISPSATSANVNIVWPLSGTYVLTLTVTDGLGNTYTKCIEVTAKDKPVAGFTFAPNNACAGSVVNFTNTTTFSGTPYYSWDFGDPASGPANASATTSPTHIYNTAGSYVVTLIAYSSILIPGGGGGTTGGHGDSLALVTCCADTIKKTVTVVNGNVKIECISTVCAGAIGKYTAVGCVSPTWGTPVGGTVIATGGNTITVQWGSGNPQGQLSVSCGGGCTAYATVPIVPLTTVIAGNTAPCNTGSSVYTAPFLPGTAYTWTLMNVTAGSNANSLLSTYPDNSTVWIDWSMAIPGNSYQLTINLNNQHLCCTSTGSLTIIPKLLYTISGPTQICAGSPGSFFPNQTGTFNWSALPAAGVTPASATGSSYTATFAIPGAYVITATNSSAAFCNSTASTSANVVPLPLPGTIVGPAVACVGSTYSYSISTAAPSGYFYEWTVSGGTFQPTGGTNTTGNSVNIQWTSLPGTISVLLKQSVAPFCSVPVSPVTVTAATVGSVSGPISVCVDGSGIYILSGGTIPPGTIVTWSLSPASLGTITSGQGSNTITVLWHGQAGSGPWGPATVSASTGCGPATPLGGIFIYPKFTLNITAGGTDICQGGVSLTANGAPGGATYSWSPGGATSQTITGITVAGTYSVTATAGGCSAFAQIAVQDPFAIAPTTCGVGICNGTATNEGLGIKVLKPLSGTFTYTWYNGQCPASGPSLATTTTTSLSNNFLAPSDGYYSVVVKYGSCQKCNTFLVKKVCCPDINNPTITDRTQLTCDKYSFTGTTPNPTGASITWDFGDGTSAPGVSGVAITHTYSNAGIYCVTFCVGPPSPNPTSCTGNCVSTDAIVPLAPGFTSKLSCNGCLTVANATAIYGPPAAVSYFWNYGDGATSTSPNPGPHCYATGGTYTVTLTVTYAGAVTCTKSVQQTVIYTPLAITSVSPVCTGTPVSFSSNPPGFVTYSWNFGDGFTGYTSPIVHAYNTSGPFLVNLSVTDALGNTCTKSANVTVQPGISNCSILPAYICPGSPATLTAPAGTYTYLWELEISPGVFSAAPGLNTSATYVTSVPGNYHVTVTNGAGCPCTSNTVAVSVVSAPKASFSISPSKSLCNPGGLAILTAPTVTGYTYAWYVNGAYGSPVSTSPVYFIFVSTTTTFNLVVTNQYGCKDTCSMTITVSPLPTPPVISASGTCAGVPISLTVTNYASNISWNTGATTTSIIVYTAGAYVATVTNPVTGCSSSTAITINKRPSAGLFPHDCDSIPCKCSRPFAIYAPTPLTGNFMSGYLYNWYDANTNTFLASGNPYTNGGLGAQTGSYVVVITDANTGCKDTSNKYSILVPPCDGCNCAESYWGELILAHADNPVGATAGNIAVKCGGKYNLECNKPYSLNAFYNCKDPACKGKVTYNLLPPIGAPVSGTGPVISFTPNISGTYVLTLYGWCGGKPCDSCIIRFTVKCPCDCKGSKWGDIELAQTDGEGVPAGTVTPPSIIKCGKSYKLDCRKTYSINPTFICKDTACKGKVTYSLLPPTGAAITGNAPLSFTPTQNGTYTLTLYGWCGEFICDSCVIKFDVICGCNCAESVWGEVILTQPVDDAVPVGSAVVNPPLTLKCGKSYALECKKTYSIAASFICKDPECKGKVTYNLVPPSGPVVSGSAPFGFTPNLTGTYVLTLYGWCGDKICDSCVIRFTANCDCDCKGSKWGDKTLSNGNTTTALACKQYEWSCNLPFTINASYICGNPNVCNSVVSYKLIPVTGSPVTGNLPLTYTPAASGTYTVVLYGYCGNKVCDSCVVSFVVACPPVCCKYEIKVQPGTVSYAAAPAVNATLATQSFTISGLTGVSLSEVRAEVLSYDISSNFNNECLACKAFPYLWASINSAGNIGIVPGLITLYNGTTTTVFNPTGAAVYQNPREVIWTNGAGFNIAGPISMNFFLPPMPLIDCCELKGKICVKFTFRDTNCNECEVIACFDVLIKK